MRKKRILSEEHKKKTSESLKKYYLQHPKTEEDIKKALDGRLEYLKNNPMTKEQKEKISISTKKYYKEHPINNEQKEKISKVQKQYKREHPYSDEYKKKISEGVKKYGKLHPDRYKSEEYLKKISDAHKGQKGRIVSEEEKKKLSESRKGSGNPMFGKHHSEEIKNIIKNKMKGRIIYWKDKAIRNSYKSLKFKNTDIEVIAKEMIDDCNIKFEQQKIFIINDIHIVTDFYIPKYKLIIECDGEYWHNYPYGTEKDKRNTKLLQEEGYNVVRLWGKDIKKMRLKDFKDLIESFKNLS